MVSISSNTFRVLTKHGAKFSLGYYGNSKGGARRFFTVSILHNKSTGDMFMMAHEEMKFANGGRPRNVNMMTVRSMKMRLALYHCIRKWSDGVD